MLLESYRAIGIDPLLHDIRFVEDDWENPTIGAWGLGWEVWCDGMEVTQFTYFQQVGGIPTAVPSAEFTYGLERLAMYVQGVENVFDLDFNGAGVSVRRRVLAQRAGVQPPTASNWRTPPCWRATSTDAEAGMRGPDCRPACRCRPTTSASRQATCSTCSTRAA